MPDSFPEIAYFHQGTAFARAFFRKAALFERGHKSNRDLYRARDGAYWILERDSGSTNARMLIRIVEFANWECLDTTDREMQLMVQARGFRSRSQINYRSLLQCLGAIS